MKKIIKKRFSYKLTRLNGKLVKTKKNKIFRFLKVLPQWAVKNKNICIKKEWEVKKFLLEVYKTLIIMIDLIDQN